MAIEFNIYTYDAYFLQCAKKEEVEVRRKDGSVYSLKSKKRNSDSPFNVAGVKIKTTTKNILDAIRDTRAG